MTHANWRHYNPKLPEATPQLQTVVVKDGEAVEEITLTLFDRARIIFRTHPQIDDAAAAVRLA
jgi:hypothetical protein